MHLEMDVKFPVPYHAWLNASTQTLLRQINRDNNNRQLQGPPSSPIHMSAYQAGF